MATSKSGDGAGGEGLEGSPATAEASSGTIPAVSDCVSSGGGSGGDSEGVVPVTLRYLSKVDGATKAEVRGSFDDWAGGMPLGDDASAFVGYFPLGKLNIRQQVRIVRDLRLLTGVARCD